MKRESVFRGITAALLVTATSIFMVMLLIRLPQEEEKLIERFGDEYRVYLRRTGRLMPRIKRD
jgi:protein-S-isoprenylcysteine O-methyltransferase Ste14